MYKPLLIILDPVKAPGTSFVRPLLLTLEQYYRVELHEYARWEWSRRHWL